MRAVGTVATVAVSSIQCCLSWWRSGESHFLYNAQCRLSQTVWRAGGDENGKVMEETVRLDDDYEEEEKGRNEIKLGLGNFIFYSLLVPKAAQGNGFTSFVACFLSILACLGWFCWRCIITRCRLCPFRFFWR